MKYRNTIIVLVVLSALIGYVYYDNQQPKDAGIPTPTPSIALLNVNAADVVGVTVTGPVTRTVIRRDGSVWFMDEPTKEEADSSRIDNLVAVLAKLSATRSLTTTPTNLAPFGLVTGTLTLEVKLKDNRTETIRLGHATIDNTSFYAQHIGDSKVYLVSSSIQTDLNRMIEVLPQKPTPTPTSPPPPTAAPTSETPTPTATSETPAAGATPTATSMP